jgi:hypothetical protein
LTPTWSIKKGTRYRYYISTTLLRGKAANTSNRLRIPANDLEAVVISRLRNLQTDRGELLEAANGAIERRRSGFGPLMERARQISNEIDAQNPEQIKSIIAALIHRVETHADHLTIDVSRQRLITLLTTSAINPIMTAQSDIDTEYLLKLTAPTRRRRLGRELKLLVDDPTTTAHVNKSLVRLLARAHDIQSRLSQNPTLTVHDISRGARRYSLHL